MHIFKKITIFIILFSILFWSLRLFRILPLEILKNNLLGISSLYSVITLIFSIISAFVIQNQWNRWTNIETALKGETDALWELIIFTEQLSPKIRKKLKVSIKIYLQKASRENWKKIENNFYPKETEIALRNIQRNIINLANRKEIETEMARSIFLEIISNRNNRVHHSAGRLPFLLYILILVVTAMVILFSLLISINNTIIDYILTTSIGFLGVFIFTIIDDLNNPFRPGSWHITSRKYSKLLSKVR
jgi:hypothetical protein